ncbi:MAG: head GIN domain-containing protein [Flavobacteriaceae bacterium]
MKKLTSMLLVMVSLAAFSQDIIDKEVGDFNQIKVYDLIEVNLIESDQNRIFIKGENVYDIKYVNKDGVLKLKMQLEKKFSGERTLIEVYYRHLDVVDSNEGARIVFNEMIKQDEIELKAQEGGRIRAGIDVDFARIKAVTGGVVEASGMAKKQTINLNTGGMFRGQELKTERSSVKISAGGEAELHASKKVQIDVTAGGDVYVYGNPEVVEKNTFAGGRVHFKD